MTIQSWDLRWMALVETISLFSKDKSRKIGAVAISEHDQNLLSIGWNGNPRGIADTEERSTRINKYRYVIHAESNLIASAARNAIRLDGSTVYVNLYPCANCAKLLIQSGIKTVVTYKPDFDDLTYAEDFKTTTEMFEEVGMIVRFVDGNSPQRKND